MFYIYIYIYIFSPHICLFIVPYTCKWMDCMKHCFAGLCFRIFILTYKRLISYLPFMLCKFYSDEYSHAIYNSCLEVRHLARVSLYGPCWRGLSLLAHLQVKYCTRVRLFYFTFIHVYLNLFLHVHKRLFFLYAPLYCHLPFLLLRSENTAFAHLFKYDSFLLLRFDCVLFTTTFCCAATSYLSSTICRHSFVSFIPTHVLRKVIRDALQVQRWPLRHYTCERMCYCTMFPSPCKLCFLLHVNVIESRGSVILPACVMPTCLSCPLFTCHFASFSQ